MNIPPTLAKKSYNRINDVFYQVYCEVASNSLLDSTNEIHSLVKEEQDVVVDEDVSLDGTWQKKGHSCKNGVVTAISAFTGKSIDYHVMSKSCKGCQAWSKRQDDPNYNEWKNNRNCHINHTKSLGAMEAAGAVTVFKRSLDKNNLRYVSYIGDGDTSSFNEVNNSNLTVTLKS